MEAKLYRYVDPRTGDTEYASPDDIDAIKRYLVAWKFYWDGPMSEATDEESTTTIYLPLYTREEWLLSDERYNWFSTLTDEQQQTLAESDPPEEVPVLESVHD